MGWVGNEGVDINWDASPVSSPFTVLSHRGEFKEDHHHYQHCQYHPRRHPPLNITIIIFIIIIIVIILNMILTIFISIMHNM